MALAGTARGTGTNTTSATSFTLAPNGNFASGSWAVLALSVDNAGSSGTALATFTVTDSLGNTWTRRRTTVYDPGAANAGVEGAVFTTPQDGGTLTTGTTITVSFGSTSVPVKVWTLTEVTRGGNGIAYVNGSNGTGSATASPTVTTGSITSGNIVFGFAFNEYGTAQTPTGDSDTTNGSWSTMQTAEAGTTAAGQTIITQWKVVNATGTQTYNPTLGTSSDVILAWIELRETTETTKTFTYSGGGTYSFSKGLLNTISKVFSGGGSVSALKRQVGKSFSYSGTTNVNVNSVETNSSGDYVRRTANLPAYNNFTISGWFKRVTAQSSVYEAVFGLDLPSTNWVALQYNSNGTQWGLDTSPSTFAAFSSKPADGNWVYVSLSSSASVVTARWWNASGVLQETVTTTPQSSFTPTGLWTLSNGWNEVCFGRAAYVRVWDAELSESELQSELASATPVRTTNLNTAFVYDGTDVSGNGRNWTLNGTTTSSDVPPISGSSVTFSKVITWAKSLAYTASAVASFTKEFFSGGGGTQYTRTFTYTAAAGVSLGKLHAFTKALTYSGAAQLTASRIAARLKSFTYTGPASVSFSQLKQAIRSFTYQGAANVTFAWTKVYLRAFAIPVTATVNFLRTTSFKRAFTYSGLGAVVVSRLQNLSKSIAITAGVSVSLARQIAKSFGYTASVVSALVKDIFYGSIIYYRSFTFNAGVAVGLGRAIAVNKAMTVAATVSRTASGVYAITKSWTIPPAISIAKRIGKVAQLTVPVTVSRIRQLSKQITTITVPGTVTTLTAYGTTVTKAVTASVTAGLQTLLIPFSAGSPLKATRKWLYSYLNRR